MSNFIEVIPVEHPLLKQKIQFARDSKTGYVWFRQLINEISKIMAVEALRDLQIEKSKNFVLQNDVLFVAKLRSGLSMIEAFQELYPICKFGYIGVDQDFSKSEVYQYMFSLPKAENMDVFFLSPAIGAGYQTSVALNAMLDHGISANKIRIVSILTRNDGFAFLNTQERYSGIKLFTARIGDEFDGDGFSDRSIGSIGNRLSGWGH
jgi:uracil phosphoribosyltransferase